MRQRDFEGGLKVANHLILKWGHCLDNLSRPTVVTLAPKGGGGQQEERDVTTGERHGEVPYRWR